MVMGALGGMGAATVCHPFDVVRVQLQIDAEGGKGKTYNGAVDAAKKIYARSGLKRGLYAGLSAAYLRQWTYGAGRVGIYSYLLHGLRAKKEEGEEVTFVEKLGMGCIAGGMGSFMGVPAELSLVRMSADSKLPTAQQRGYGSVFSCLSMTAKEEGVKALWTGGTPTIIRAVLLSSTMLATYSEIKVALNVKFPTVFIKDGLPSMFVGTMIASFIANSIINPLDVVKSRIQNMRPPAAGEEAVYKNMVDCFAKTIKLDGARALYSGFIPAFTKLAPYSCISLIITEKLTMAYTGKAAL